MGQKHTTAGRKIIQGLQEIVHALENGLPLEKSLTVHKVSPRRKSKKPSHTHK
jgi:exonuclease VII small subunit